MESVFDLRLDLCQNGQDRALRKILRGPRVGHPCIRCSAGISSEPAARFRKSFHNKDCTLHGVDMKSDI